MFSPTDPRIRTIGRVDTRDAAVPRFAWPATGFAFRFTGTSLGLELEDTPLPHGTRENDWLALWTDGEPAPALPLVTGRRQYLVAARLAPGTHEVQVAKRTEAEVGTVGLLGIALDSGAVLKAAPARPRRIIEVVGDSISTGFGIEGASADCSFSAATENATRTYGALAARALDADVWIVAWKGKGVLRNNDPAEPEPLPVLYGRLAPADGTSTYSYRVHPDAVVVNLGTNDFAQGVPPAVEFQAAYSAFVARLRALHPAALLVLVVGPMLFDEGRVHDRTVVRSAIDAVISASRARGDVRLELLELWTDPADGVGCQFHPNAVTHQRMADELVRLLEARLGW